MGKNVYLVGFMGSGKSVVGRRMSGKLNCKFIEMDELIEEKEGTDVVDIFSLKGEDYFRVLEKNVLKEIATQSSCIISCGGGVVIDPENIVIIKKSGIMIWLNADAETIYQRIKSFKHRPLLNVDEPKKKIKELLDQRKSFYAQADYTLNTSGSSIDEVVEGALRIIDGA